MVTPERRPAVTERAKRLNLHAQSNKVNKDSVNLYIETAVEAKELLI